MKLDQLRKIIREEVRSAVKEELQDVMNEAVKYASTPYEKPVPKFLNKLLSLKSLCILEMGKVLLNKFHIAFDNNKFASAFSKYIGLFL